MTRVKVCGLTRLEDARLAAGLGAWATGFVFYERSPRCIAPASARPITRALEGAGALCVGVFVDWELDEVLGAVSSSGVGAAQLHGEETPEFCGKLRARAPALKLIKALSPRSPADLALAAAYEACCDYLLVDTYSSTQKGGTGRVADWKLAQTLARRCPIPVILAGGLGADNAAQAVAAVRPWALDVSSSLESAPGIKSESKMRDFFAALNPAGAHS